MTTIISAPGDLIIATSDGVGVRFAGIEPTFRFPTSIGPEAGNGGITVYFEGVTGDETRNRDIRYLEELDHWIARRKVHGADASGPYPVMPGVPVLERVKVRIFDDVGTEYRWAGGSLAGTGTEWEGCWGYAPAPPENARFLTLDFTLDDELTGKRCQLQLK